MVFLCDFHREQAWLRWLGNQQHGVHMHKEEILSQLRKIASSETEESLKEAIENLKKGDVWKNNPKLQAWFTKTWLPETKVPKEFTPIYKFTKHFIGFFFIGTFAPIYLFKISTLIALVQ